MNKLNFQQKYWKLNKSYISRNKKFDNKLGAIVWKKLLKKKKIFQVLECGSNIGRNLKQINIAYPRKKLSFIEINKKAYEICKKNKNIFYSYNSSIENCKIKNNSFDLVFTSGVLIHVSDSSLKKIINNMTNWTKKYILVMEYFSTSRIEKKYRGKRGLLFTRDYGKEFLKNKKLKLLDCGFFYSKIYKKAGFDDLTFWFFELKK